MNEIGDAEVPSESRKEWPGRPGSGTLVRAIRLPLAVFAVLVAAGTAMTVGASTAYVNAPASAVSGRTDSATIGVTASTIVPGRGLYGSRWNPCKPITYLMPARRGYRGSAADIRHAVRIVAAATGMRFVEVGSQLSEPDVTFKWESPATKADLAGAVAARTGTTTLTHDGVVEIASATIHLDRTTPIRQGFATSGPPDWGQVYLHELGHAVGLSHVSRRVEIMNRAVSRFNHVLAAGDRSRLHVVGRAAGCIPNSIR